MNAFVLGSEQLWWLVSRASGITAWALSALAVVSGLALSTRALGAKPRAPWLTDLHRFLGGLTIAFVGVHIAGLVVDSYVEFSWAEILVPMASEWRRGAVAWGVVAFYLLLAVELTSLVKTKISKKIWKRVHLLSFPMYVLGTVHLFTAGTDATNPMLRWSAIATVAIVAFFLIYSAIGPGRVASIRGSRSPTKKDGRAGHRIAHPRPVTGVR